MRKALIAVFGIGAAGAIWLLSQGTTYDLAQYAWFIESWLRRAQLKTQSVVSDDRGFSKALDMIAGFELFRSHAYPDANGYSIGYGHFIREGDGLSTESVVSESQAYDLLSQDAQSAANCVDASVEVTLNDNQRAALISFVYNEGCGAFRKSTMLRKINAGDFEGASQEFSKWTLSQGEQVTALVTRRQSESEVFSS